MADRGTPDARPILRALLDPDPENPRRGSPEEVFDVADLVGSIRANGITTPLLVEPMAEGRFRLIDGERRLVAAGHVGLDVVPCIVRDDLAADERIAIQLATYATQPLPPLREAHALARLQAEIGGSYSDVAERIGRPTRYVEQRIALLSLAPEAQAALAAGKITLGVVFGRTRNPGLVALTVEGQVRAIERMFRSRDPDAADALGIAGAGWAITEELLGLAHAPFPVEDAALPGGPCGRCPKRTGAQLLLDGAPESDACADRGCWTAKADAHRKRSLPVVEDDRREPTADDPAIDEDDEPPRRERRKDLPAAKPKGSAADDAKLQRLAEDAARQKALAKIASAFAKKKPDEKLWRTLASFIVRTCGAVYDHVLVDAVQRRLGEEGGRSYDIARKRLLAELTKASIGECAGLMAELLAGIDDTENEDDVFILACRAAKVDHAALVDEELEKARAKAPPADPKPNGKAAKKKTEPVIGAHEREILAAEILRLLHDGLPRGESAIVDVLGTGDAMKRRKLAAVLESMARGGDLEESEPGVYRGVVRAADAKPETVQLDGAARKAAEARACPKCSAKVGKPCLGPKGKLGTGWFHRERATANLEVASIVLFLREQAMAQGGEIGKALAKVAGEIEDAKDIDRSAASKLVYEMARKAPSPDANKALLEAADAIVDGAPQVKPKAKAEPTIPPGGVTPEIIAERAAELRRIGAFLRARSDGKHAAVGNALRDLAAAIEGWKPETIPSTVRASVVSHLRAMATKIPAAGAAIRGAAEAVLAGEYLPKMPEAKPAPKCCAVCGCSDAAACRDGADWCTWEKLGDADVCSVCLRTCQATLKICAKPQTPAALRTALTKRQKGPNAPETWDTKRAALAVTYLEHTGQLRRDGAKLVAAQPRT